MQRAHNSSQALNELHATLTTIDSINNINNKEHKSQSTPGNRYLFSPDCFLVRATNFCASFSDSSCSWKLPAMNNGEARNAARRFSSCRNVQHAAASSRYTISSSRFESCLSSSSSRVKSTFDSYANVSHCVAEYFRFARALTASVTLRNAATERQAASCAREWLCRNCW